MTKPVNSKLYLERKEVIDSNSLVALYSERVQNLGYSGRTMFYKDQAQYQRKLQKFAAMLGQVLRPEETLLDVGCGYGSLFPLLPKCRYKGIDIVPEFVSCAQTRYPRGEFAVENIHSSYGKYDWCVLLGVVNGVAEPTKLIEATWQSCLKGLIVDFIDAKRFRGRFLNRFRLGDCLSDFLDFGAHSVEVFPTPEVWTIFLVRKNFDSTAPDCFK